MGNKLYTLYYLLFQIRNYDVLWIVKISTNYYDLKRRIKYYYSKDNLYYIVSNDVSHAEFNSKFKQFTKFNPNIIN